LATAPEQAAYLPRKYTSFDATRRFFMNSENKLTPEQIRAQYERENRAEYEKMGVLDAYELITGPGGIRKFSEKHIADMQRFLVTIDQHLAREGLSSKAKRSLMSTKKSLEKAILTTQQALLRAPQKASRAPWPVIG
jgi:hypothetical protein